MKFNIITTFILTTALSLHSQSGDSLVELDAFTVTAFEREYRELVSSTALGFSASTLQIPLTTTVIPTDILDDQQVNRVENALRNVAGVQRYKTGNGGEEEFAIRGFDSGENIYKDGIRINSRFNASNIATTETANLERIEVLLGVGSILYGQGLPGGIVNYITKKPQFEQSGSLEVLYGSWDSLRAEADITGPLTLGGDDETLAYRLVVAYENSGDFRDFIERDRLLINPSMTWEISDNSRLTVYAEYMQDAYTQDRGQILDGNGIDGYTYSARLDPEMFFGIPGHNTETDLDSLRLYAKYEHQFTDTWKTELLLSTTDVEKTNVDSSPTFIRNQELEAVGESPENLQFRQTISDSGWAAIQPRFTDGEGGADSLVWNHFVDFTTDTIQHQAHVSLTYENLTTENSNFRGTNNVLFNVVDRRYLGTDFTLRERAGAERETEEWGVLAQDLMSIGDHWNVLLGARYSNHEFVAFSGGLSEQSSEAFTPRAGVIYRPESNWAFYVNAALGYLPSEAIDVNGDILDPETNQQLEAGIKWENEDGNLSASIAVYEITREDIAGFDPASIGSDEAILQNFGDTRSRGLEIQTIGELLPGWRFIAGYSFVDSEITRAINQLGSQGVNVDVTGNREPGVPEHGFNFWSVYEFQDGPLEGFGFGGGVFASSEVFVSRENRAEYDGWTQVDAVAYYKKDNWKVQLNIENLFDEQYNLAQSSVPTDFFGAIRVGTSRPLNATFSVAYGF